MDSLIAIPSRSRYRSVLEKGTIKAIPIELLPHTKLFVPRDQHSQYKQAMYNYLSALNRAYDQVEIVSTDSPNIALKRKEMAEWAKNRGYTKILMIDDDITAWATRNEEGKTGLRKSTPQDIKQMFDTIIQYLDWYAAVGVSARFRNDSFVGEFPVVVENHRMIRFNSYQIDKFLDCIHGRFSTGEDMDIQLQLLLKGYKTATLYQWTHDQAATGTPGGCADYRTLEVHNQDKQSLKDEYPDYVRLVHKRNISDQAIKAGMAERLEVVIDWKKAYEYGLRNKQSIE